MSLIQPSLYLLVGFSTYAALHHLLNLRAPGDRLLHTYMVTLCASAALFAVTQAQLIQATDRDTFVLALRWNLMLAALIYTLVPWFIAEFTGWRPRALLWGFTVLFAGLGVSNLVLPFSMQYLRIDALVTAPLPWGESWTRVVGQINPWFSLATLGLLGVTLYALAALWRLRGAANTRWALGGLLAFMAATMQGVLARQGVLDFMPLGVYGMLVMVLGLSAAIQSRWRQTQRNNQTVLDQVPALIYLRDARGLFLLANERYAVLNGSTVDELPGRTLHDLWQGAVAEDLLAKDRAVIASGTTLTFEEVLRHREEDRTYLTHRFPLRGSDGSVVAVGGISTDITDRKRMENVLRDLALGPATGEGHVHLNHLVEQLARLFRADHAFIARVDRHPTPTAHTLALYSRGAIAPNFSYPLADTPCADVMDSGTCVHDGHVQSLFPQDSLLREMGIDSYIGTSLTDAQGEVMGLMVVLHRERMAPPRLAMDILEILAARTGADMRREQAERRLRRLAHEDYLTGLSSRSRLHEHLQQALASARAHQGHGAVLMLDLDHFKTINDALGHDMGDQVLCEVGRRLSRLAGEGALVARLDGDGFVMVLPPRPGVTAEQAQEHAHARATAALADLARPVHCGPQVLNVAASVGLAVFPDGDTSERDVLRRADMALHRAKRNGRKGVQAYQADMLASAQERLQIEKGLHEALERDQFHLVFQPQVDGHGRQLGLEALLRWRHPRLGVVPPDRFIRVAEETGLIQPIGQWVLRQALKQVAVWRDAGVAYGHRVSVNVSAWQFARDDFVDLVQQALGASGVPATSLTLELTESALLYDVRAAIEKLARLRAIGLQIALDDFGTGYSSLAYLRDLPLDELKIDKSFVHELDRGRQHPLIGAMVAIGRQMDLRVIAEGVETEEQFHALVDLGCSGFQGYRFSPPLPESELLPWLRSRASA